VIFFVAPREDLEGITEYLQQAGAAVGRRLTTVTYDDIVARRRLAVGTYIFAAIDELTPTEREIAMRCCEELRRASPDIRLINQPAEVRLRYDLLRTCFELKRNTFRVRRASQFHRCRRFPVFVRPEHEHLGSLTPMLHSRRQLVRALVESVVRGYRLRDLLIIEFCDTADPSGVYRMYSAVVVGDRILPKTLLHNRNWVTKWKGRLLDADKAREQAEYVEGDLHAGWLKETFSLAGIGYGRMDYGVKDGVPQVWEINTNPTLVRRTGSSSTMSAEQWTVLAPAQEAFLRRFEAAFEAIDTDIDPCRTIPIDVSPRQVRGLEAERRLKTRLLARRTAISLIARGPGWLLRRLSAGWR
jgi:hypothetical protein